jgi:hypothetical protein
MAHGDQRKKEPVAKPDPNSEREHKSVPGPGKPFPFSALRDIILLVAGLLVGPVVQYMTNKPKWAIYSGAIGICILILFFAHAWVTSLEKPSKGPNHSPLVQNLTQPSEPVIAAPKFAPQKEKPQAPAPRKVPQSPKTALSADEAQTFREKIENYTFSLGGGGVHVTYSVDALRAGPKDPFYLGGFSPVRVYLDDEKLFADCAVYAGPGRPPVEVKKNQFVVRPASWDRNFSSKALEIVDSQQNAVFQLIYKTPSHIVVNGIFPFPGGLILADESGMLINPTLPTTFRLNRIFKYPSWKYPGQYEEPPK